MSGGPGEGAEVEWIRAGSGWVCGYAIGWRDAEGDDADAPRVPVACGGVGLIAFRSILPPRGKVTEWSIRCDRHTPPSLKAQIRAEGGS